MYYNRTQPRQTTRSSLWSSDAAHDRCWRFSEPFDGAPPPPVTDDPMPVPVPVVDRVTDLDDN